MNKNKNRGFVLPKVAGAFGGGLMLVLLSQGTAAQIAFEDVTSTSGMTGFTESWGASWGDMNGDNWPDLFNQGHRDFPRFYRNTGEGSFQDVAYEKDPGNWIAFPLDDKHGAAWADYDNDGDEDLLLSVSATGPAQFLVNENGNFTDHAYEADLNNDSAARLPIWFDYNEDGHLDVAQLNTNDARLRVRDPDAKDHPLYDFDSDSGAEMRCYGQLNYGHLMDIDGNGSLEVICAEEGIFPVQVYEVTEYPFRDRTSWIPDEALVNNTIVADFNNDLRYDIVGTRGSMRPSGVSLIDPHNLHAWLRKDDSQPAGKGFNFESDGEITVMIDHRGMGVYEQSKIYVLDPNGQTDADAGPVAVRWSDSRNRWEARVEDGGSMQTYIRVEAVAPISNIEEVNFDTPEAAQETIHWVNSANGLDRVFNTGLWTPVHCGGIAAGDFDNDMDVDLYLACRRGAENLPNRIYENQGDGTFVEILNHGAEGPVGTGFEYGVADGAFIADYDVDGFLDIYVANGLLYYPVGVGGPDTLIRNKGNGNHWIEIDLAGTVSNRDGVGAKVYATAGGVTQLREQNGGYSRWGQNHQRIHFGLGSNTTVDITIEWPSGNVDTFNNVAADRLYDATENGSMTVATLGPPVYTELQAGDECGQPPYDLDYGPAVLLWKNCSSGVWSLRARGGRFMEYPLMTGGSITSDSAFGDLNLVNISAWDTVDNTVAQEILFAIGSWYSNNKGFDFSTAGQSQSCFDLDLQDIPALIVGGSKKWIEPPFDLVTLGACAAQPPVDPECGDPNLAPASDHGLFVWKDCGHPGPEARWTVMMSGGGAPWAPHEGRVVSDTVIGATGISLEGSDVLDSTPGDTVVDFVLKVGGSGTDGFQIDVPAGSSTCLITEDLPAGVTVYLGKDRQVQTGNFDLLTLAPCADEPPPPADPECGEPSYDAGSTVGVFLWRDCDAPGNDAAWSMRITGGGTGWSNYAGTLVSQSSRLSPTGFSLEAHDTLDTTPGDGTVDYDFFAGGTGVDGFDVVVPAGADACFTANTMPAGAQVVVGADNQIMSGPFDLSTLGACN